MTPNCFVSFELKITILVLFERYYFQMPLIEQKYVSTFVRINTENSSSSIFFVGHKIVLQIMKTKNIQLFTLLKVKKIKTKIGYKMKKKYGFNQKRCNEVIYTKTYKKLRLGKSC